MPKFRDFGRPAPIETKECPRCWFNLRRWLLKHDRERVEQCPHCDADLVRF